MWRGNESVELEDAQRSFCSGVWTTDQIFTLQKFSRNLGSMSDMSVFVLLTTRKHTNGSFEKILGIFDSLSQVDVGVSWWKLQD